MYREVDTELADDDVTTWSESDYQHVDVIAADRVFVDNSDAVINVETRSVPVARRRRGSSSNVAASHSRTPARDGDGGGGVYFVFRDQVSEE